MNGVGIGMVTILQAHKLIREVLVRVPSVCIAGAVGVLKRRDAVWPLVITTTTSPDTGTLTMVSGLFYYLVNLELASFRYVAQLEL